MAFNTPCCLKEITEIGEVIGVERGGHEQMAAETIHRIRELCARIQIPRTLKDLGLQEEKLDWVAEQSMLSARLINNNPRKLEMPEVKQIVSNAYYGHH